MAVEVVIAGMSINVTSPPPPFAGPTGLGPPCSAVIGPFGWLVAFWVSKSSKNFLCDHSHFLNFHRQYHFSMMLLLSCRSSFTIHENVTLNSCRLTAWKAYGFWKREVDTPLFNIIWRDGLLYFFAIFSMNVANVIIFLAAPKTLRPVNLT